MSYSLNEVLKQRASQQQDAPQQGEKALDDLKTKPTNEGNPRTDDFVHLNVLKVDWNSMARVNGAYLTGGAMPSSVTFASAFSKNDDHYYNLNGQVVDHPKKGIFVKNGKKIIIK